MQQTAGVREYMDLFEKLRSRLVLEGRHFSNLDYIDAFVGGMKGEIKSFVKLFKLSTIEEAFGNALHVEEVIECQSKKLKLPSKIPQSTPTPSSKFLERHSSLAFKQSPVNKSLIEQRRALGQCFKYGDKYFLGHLCKVKVQMLIGQEEEYEQEATDEQAVEVVEPNSIPSFEEAIVSMHATSNNPKVITMCFKGYIGTIPINALVDNGSTHSFVNPMVLRGKIIN
jgi:hypothetical protein